MRSIKEEGKLSNMEIRVKGVLDHIAETAFMKKSKMKILTISLKST